MGAEGCGAAPAGRSAGQPDLPVVGGGDDELGLALLGDGLREVGLMRHDDLLRWGLRCWQ
jgi:hypothetical protein